jgi:hypothetical protein
MSRRMWLAVFVLLAAVGLACNGTANGPPSDFCVTTADNPHISSVGLRKGVFEIVGKGWFKCTKSPSEVTVYVEIQQKRLALWATIGEADPPGRFHNPPAGKKSNDVVVSVPCDKGTFRTRARAHAIDTDGTRVEQSEWSLSAEVTDPCKGKT